MRFVYLALAVACGVALAPYVTVVVSLVLSGAAAALEAIGRRLRTPRGALAVVGVLIAWAIGAVILTLITADIGSANDATNAGILTLLVALLATWTIVLGAVLRQRAARRPAPRDDPR